MDELSCLRIFLEVSRRRSFAGAAQHFGVSRATCTKQVAWLEQSFGVKLLNRSTKQLGLTQAGAYVVENSVELLERFDQFKQSVHNISGGISGTVRVGVPPSFGAHRLVPVIDSFLKENVSVEISMSLLTARKYETFVKQGLDVGIIVVHTLQDASYIAIPLFEIRQCLVASPEYLAEQPEVIAPQDLQAHNCLINDNKAPTAIWSFTGSEGNFNVRVRGSLHSNYGEALKLAALAGTGISMHPYYMVTEEIAEGRLKRVLPEYEPTTLHAYAIYADRENLPLRVRLFLDFLKSWAQAPKIWNQP